MKKIVLASAVALLAVAAPLSGAVAQMSHDGGHHGHDMTAAEGIMAMGAVNSVDAEKRTINITHDPIAELSWPTMTMDFAVAESVDLSGLEKGQKVSFTLTRGADDIYMINSLTKK